jgi:hypothetical protein
MAILWHFGCKMLELYMHVGEDDYLYMFNFQSVVTLAFLYVEIMRTLNCGFSQCIAFLCFESWNFTNVHVHSTVVSVNVLHSDLTHTAAKRMLQI